MQGVVPLAWKAKDTPECMEGKYSTGKTARGWRGPCMCLMCVG